MCTASVVYKQQLICILQLHMVCFLLISLVHVTVNVGNRQSRRPIDCS